MFEIHKRPSRDLRNNYPELAHIVREHNAVVITNKGDAELVLVNLADWEEFKEYQYNQYVLKKLKEVEAVADRPDTWLSEEEFWEKARSL
jgi:PHD/YefM family antitoxin component YafN of YafNO toxin-antitoxin module